MMLSKVGTANILKPSPDGMITWHAIRWPGGRVIIELLEGGLGEFIRYVMNRIK